MRALGSGLLPRLITLLTATALLAACGSSAAPPAASTTVPPAALPSAGAPPAAAPSPVIAASPASAASSQPSPAASPTASNAPAGPLTHLDVSYGEVVPQELTLWVTKEAGLFAKHGLDVDLHLIISAQEVAAIIAGDTQFANPGGPNVLNAVSNGADLVVIAVPLGISPFSIYSQADITSMADLQGKNVGISQFGSPSELEMRLALQKAGMDPQQDVTFIQTGSTQNRTAALIQGTIQGAAANPLEGATLKAAGLHVIFDLASLREPFAETTTTVRRDWMNQHRDLVQDYVDAIVEGLQRERNDKAFAVSVLKKYYNSDDDAAMSAAYDAYINLFPTLPTPLPEQFQAAQTTLVATNAAVANVDLNQLIDPEFVDNAQSRGLGN